MVWQQPQFAYTPGRLLEVAVLRAVHHCQTVKEVIRAQQRNVREKKKGLGATACAGGAILALDMSQAFDRVDRQQLHHSLEHSNLPQWHNGIAYHLRSANKTSCVRCGRGLRQGCPMSPTLWNAITSRVMTILEQRLGQAWVRNNSTFFADDILGKWVFHSVADLKFMLRAIDALFTVLEEFGMKINSLKSALIIDVRGHSGKQWLRARTKYLEKKPYSYAKTESGRLLSIPIQSETKYLGTIISFGNFAKATVRYRIQQAETQRRRLQRILQGKHTLNLSQRIRLWRTCVWTSLQHGLHAIGLGRDELKSIRSCCARHLRAIASCPVHITRDSTTELFLRLKVPEPQELLQKRLDGLDRTMRYSPDPMMNTPHLLTTLETHLESFRDAVHYWTGRNETPTHMPSDTNCALLKPREGGMWLQPVLTSCGVKPAMFTCPACLLSFVNLGALKIHHHEAHDGPLPPPFSRFDRHVHSCEDVPKCRHS